MNNDNLNNDNLDVNNNVNDVADDVNVNNDASDVSKDNSTTEDVNKMLIELQAANKDLKDNYLRAYAEIDNIKKRSAIELRKKEKYAISSFARDLLPVMDSLEKALETVPQDNTNDLFKSFVDGMDITLKELKNAFTKFNITEISSIGEKFNPDRHQVLQTIEDADKDDGVIVSQWQKGYMIDDRVLRDSKVIVVKNNK